MVLLVADLLVFYQFVRGRTPDIAFGNDNAVGPVVVFIAWLILLLGPCMGLAQTFVLRRFAPSIVWQKWIGASLRLVPIIQIVLVTIAVLLGFVLRGDRYAFGALVSLPGLGFGLAYWPLLRRSGSLRAGVWLVGWMAGMAVFAGLTGVVLIWLLRRLLTS